MTTSNIALSKLTVSDQNVRVVAPDKAAHQRLMASIASQGVLQNLVVVPDKKDHFQVIAGGRRLRALQALAKQKAIPNDYPVPCLVKTDTGDITEISAATLSLRAVSIMFFGLLPSPGWTSTTACPRCTPMA